MCGILGIVNIENRRPIDPELPRNMVSTMVHRGPDGAGVWIQDDGQCCLAHRRLSIVDLSDAASQPMGSEDAKIWVTFNGEIYNYPSLRKEYERKGYTFNSNSDTEIILHLYREHGEAFYEYLDGDFAIGLWDCNKQKLVLIRDRAGVKPIYYSYIDGRLIFASEMKALLTYPGIDKSVDPISFYHYLTYLVVPPPKTIIKSIFKLEAASALKLLSRTGSCPLPDKYWLPVPDVKFDGNYGELDEELQSLFSASVKKRLMADVPIGVLFSGGVDSTLNLCSFSELIAPELVKTFTVGMENAGGFHDDSTNAKRLARRVGSEHHEIRISEFDLIATAEKLAYLQDEPVSDPVSVPLYFVTKHAREHGVSVLQAGEGADELFCGYDNYRRFMQYHAYLWQPLMRLPQFVSRGAANLLERSDNPRTRKIRDVLMRRAKGQKLFMSSAVAYYELEKQRILSPDLRFLVGETDSFDVIAPYYAQLAEYCPDATFLQQLTFIELQLRLPELLLMRADKMSMANSVEIRVPFLDRDLIDFAMRIPDSYKIRNGVSKDPIKKLAAGYVGQKEVYKPKTGFGVPIQQWFKGPLGDALLDLLHSNHSINQLFDRNAIVFNLQHGLRTVNEGFQMWVIFNMLAWQNGLKDL